MTDTSDRTWWALYYHYGSLETEKFDTERDAVMYLDELDDGSPVAVHGPNGYKLGQAAIACRARQFWEAEHPEEAAAERRKAEERRRRAEDERAQYEAWLAQQPDWYRAEVSSIKVTRVGHLHRVDVNGQPLPFRVRHAEFQTDETFGPDGAPALVLHLDFASPVTIEYGSAETSKPPQTSPARNQPS